MRIITDLFENPRHAETLLVLLPPAEARIDDFYSQGFVEAVRQRRIPIDIVLAEVTYQHVMTKTAVSSLITHVIRPAQGKFYHSIWLSGISLGAFNALHFISLSETGLAGVHLMSPYPGTADLLEEMIKAGGPMEWSRCSPTNLEGERAWWHWLCRSAESRQWKTPVHFSSGSEDRFIHGQRMLSDLLPIDQVRYLPGNHDWQTWKLLWSDWLDRGPLANLTPYPEGAC
jgi:hypothetical protein